jgi:signal transduction histidine kinase
MTDPGRASPDEKASTQDASTDVAVARFCHDLRQYVAAGLLISQMPGDEYLDSALQERLETIRQLFRHTLDLIAAQVGDPPRGSDWHIDLAELVDDCVKVLELTHDVSVKVDRAGAVPAYADPVMIRRAVTNVLDNASRAVGSGGSVSVRVEAGPSGEARVEVEDDGLGFGRIPSVNGHGLSIVDMAMRECRGRMEISSGPGPGTTVRLHVPSSRPGSEP